MPLCPIATETDPQIVALCSRFAQGRQRLTKPRVKLLRAVLGLDAPASIDDIYQTAGMKICDRTTAARSLVVMERLGILRRVFSGKGGVLFERVTNPEPLYLFSKTGEKPARIELPRSVEIAAAVRRVEENLRALGYTDVSHVIQFFGTPSPKGTEAPEPAPTMAKAKRLVTKRRKPAKPTKAERARRRVTSFLRRRFEAEPSA